MPGFEKSADDFDLLAISNDFPIPVLMKEL